MKTVFFAFLIGTAAGLIDILPMLARKMDKLSMLSALVHWMVLGLIIPYVDWSMSPWLKGIVLAEMTALPIILMVVGKELGAVVPMVASSAILGALVGFVGDRIGV
jgi:hypothetical protein